MVEHPASGASEPGGNQCLTATPQQSPVGKARSQRTIYDAASQIRYLAYMDNPENLLLII
jgi:hypothetical protein